MLNWESVFECEITEDFDIKILGNLQSKRRFLVPFKGKKLKVTISEMKSSKTKAQLAFWFGVIIPQCIAIHKELEGEDLIPILMHVAVCISILDTQFAPVIICGKPYLDPERFRFTKASIGDVTVAIEKVVKYYAERGYYIETQDLSKFKTLSDYE